jgi:hypothetical protein
MIVKRIHAFVDRIEGDKAVLLVGENEEHTIVIPAEYLPEGAGSGSVLTVDLRYEPELTAQARDEVSDLIKRLRNRDAK